MSPTPQPVEFSVNLAVLSPDDKTQISFGISRHNTSTGSLLLIDFVLRTLDQASGQFQDRVKLHVAVGPSDSAEAQAMADRGLTMTQLQFLQGPVTTRAQAVAAGAAGSGQPVTSDNKLEKQLAVVPHLGHA